MSIISVIKSDNKIIMGYDSASYDNGLIRETPDDKIWIDELKVNSETIKFLIGYSGDNIKLKNELKYYFSNIIISDLTIKDSYKIIFNIVEEIKEKATSIKGYFILASKYGIYIVYPEHEWCFEKIKEYTAIGSGDKIAMGSLYSTDIKNAYKFVEASGFTDEDRIRISISAAIKHNPYCEEPIIIKTINV